MRNVILLLLGLTCVGLTKSISQCDDYPFMLDISGFTCGNETGTICIVTNYDAWLPCEDIYEEFGFQITYPEPNFIYTDLDPSYYIPFADVSDPIGNPGTTTLYAYQEFPLQDINIVACFEGVLQTPNTVFTLSIVNDEDPSIVLNTVNFTIDNAVTIGNPNTPTLLSSWIAPNGPLLPSAQAAVTGQFVEVVGDIIVDVNYNFGTAQFGGGTYNDITMWPGTRVDITSGHTLATAFTNIHGCGSSWSRINIQGGGTFDTRFTTIRDATVAVEMQHNSTYNVRTKTDLIGNVTGIGSYGTTTKQVSLNVLTNFGNYTAVISDGTEGIHFEHVALVTVNKPLFIQNMSKAGLYLDNADFSGQYLFFTDCKDGTIVPTKNDFLSLDNCDTYFGESGVETYGTKELIVTNGAYSNLITGVAIGDLYGNSHSLIEHNTMGFSNYNVLGILAPSAGEIQYNSMTATNCNVFLWGAGTGDHKWAIQRNPQMWVQGAGQNIYLNYTNNARVFRNDEVVLSEIGRNFTMNGGSNNKIDYNLVSADKDNMQLIGSPMSLIACNRATDGSQGLVVTNDNAGAVIRGNDFTSSGLNLSYGNSGNTYAHTGEQKLKGNLFDLSSSSNKKARNFSAAAVASNNRYLVGFFRTQGDEFFPFFTANIPDWFKNAEVGDYVCPSPPIIGEEDPDIKQTYKRAAHSGIDLLEAGVGSIYGGELAFDAELKLYRHLSRLQELEPLNEAELAAWYNGFNGSNVQKFVQFETAYRNALAPSASEQQQLSTLRVCAKITSYLYF
ncbi:MAG: hypothetical protein K9J37_20215 [Saprospiraceae bacterium]|nr:hypothetical protein [Saprospiraceae bacterium]MCF8252253.1 hypothetical protein [Saprospiraceae bacterium]MCF8313918.1 hypothetical protein [Saprospiraceae bacterium]MCF8443245.1 hypothetical protein [Saprospiraceae bacterium]